MSGTLVLGFLLAHFVGDYVVQSHWMATCKTSNWFPALLHALAYTACYAFVTQSIWALLVIGGTHGIIDRYRLARHVIWLKNHLAPAGVSLPWSECKATGFAPHVPQGLAIALLIVVDNTIHLLINFGALVWLA